MNDLTDNLLLKVRLFADYCIIHQVIQSKVDEDIFQDDPFLGGKNSMTINSSKSKTIMFLRGRKYSETQYPTKYPKSLVL